MAAAAVFLGAALATVVAQDLVEPSIRVESRAGTAPELQTTKSKPFILASATPAIRIQLSDRNQDAQATLSSRLLLREPDPTKTHDVLILHRLNVNHRLQPMGRWSMRFDFSASYGKEDYTTFRETLSGTSSSGTTTPNTSTGTSGGTPGTPGMPGTSGTPAAPTGGAAAPATNLTVPTSLHMMSASATWNARYLLSRISELELQMGTVYRDSIGSGNPTTNGRTQLRKQSINTANLRYSESVSRTRRVKASLLSSYYHVNQQLDALVSEARFGILDSSFHRDTLFVDAGLSYAQNLKDHLNTQKGGFSPIATIQWDSILSNLRNRQVMLTALIGMDWGFEPISGRGAPRLPTSVGFIAQLSPYWRIGFQAAYTTSFMQAAQINGKKGSSYAMIGLPVTYRTRDRFTIETGVRGSAISPRFAGPSDFTAMELWGYVSVTADYRRRLDTL